ncbi:hypothetical protein HanIR_Chr01g0033841 [Helianthus annuus]|nr:hypothetical protein HanIR_Chr01g0033841 [Helianthus annuus]
MVGLILYFKCGFLITLRRGNINFFRGCGIKKASKFILFYTTDEELRGSGGYPYQHGKSAPALFEHLLTLFTHYPFNIIVPTSLFH